MSVVKFSQCFVFNQSPCGVLAEEIKLQILNLHVASPRSSTIFTHPKSLVIETDKTELWHSCLTCASLAFSSASSSPWPHESWRHDHSSSLASHCCNRSIFPGPVNLAGRPVYLQLYINWEEFSFLKFTANHVSLLVQNQPAGWWFKSPKHWNHNWKHLTWARPSWCATWMKWAF